MPKRWTPNIMLLVFERHLHQGHKMVSRSLQTWICESYSSQNLPEGLKSKIVPWCEFKAMQTAQKEYQNQWEPKEWVLPIIQFWTWLSQKDKGVRFTHLAPQALRNDNKFSRLWIEPFHFLHLTLQGIMMIHTIMICAVIKFWGWYGAQGILFWALKTKHLHNSWMPSKNLKYPESLWHGPVSRWAYVIRGPVMFTHPIFLLICDKPLEVYWARKSN